jgi:hypothetical protein
MMIEEHRKYMKEWGYDVWALICVGKWNLSGFERLVFDVS